MIDYNLLPYLPNIENMRDVQVEDMRSGQVFAGENRLPTVEELQLLLNEIDYTIVSVANSEDHTQLDIRDAYEPDERCLISATLFFSHLSFNQCDFSQVMEIAKAICEKRGPYYTGYNGFNEIYLIDAGTDVSAVLKPETTELPTDYLQYLKRKGIDSQSDPDLDPRIAEYRKSDKHAASTTLLCDILEDDLARLNYKRLGQWFYAHDELFVKMIAPNYVMWTSEKTMYLSATFRILNKTQMKEHGITVPEFPEINAFGRTIHIPRKQEFRAWGYKNVSASIVTDLTWMKAQQETIREYAKGFPEVMAELTK